MLLFRKPLFPLLLLVLALVACGEKREQAAPPVAEQGPKAPFDSAAFVADSIARLAAEEEAKAMPRRVNELFSDFVFSFFESPQVRLARTLFPLPSSDGEMEERLSRSDFEEHDPVSPSDTYIIIGARRQDFALDRDTTVRQVAAEYLDLQGGERHRYTFARGTRGAWQLRAVSRTTIDQHPDVAFLTFFHRFSTDSLFCLEHMASTLAMLMPSPDDEFDQIEGTIERSQWSIFGPDLPQGTFINLDYGQRLPADADRTVMIQENASGALTFLFFRRHDDSWRLYRFEN